MENGKQKKKKKIQTRTERKDKENWKHKINKQTNKIQTITSSFIKKF